MIHGTILFIYTKCKKVFLAPDIEYGAMFFSVPMPCERCGSIRTLQRCGSIRTLPMELQFLVTSVIKEEN